MKYRIEDVLRDGHYVYAVLKKDLEAHSWKNLSLKKGDIGIVMDFYWSSKDGLECDIQFPKQDDKFNGIRLRSGEQINTNELNLVNLYRRTDLKNLKLHIPDPTNEDLFLNPNQYKKSPYLLIKDEDHKDQGQT